MKNTLVILITAMISQIGFSQNNLNNIKLPIPQKNGGMPIMEAFNNRHTSRNFIDKEFSLQELSNLLWSTFGINRDDVKKRTAPSAMNCQEIDIYIAIKKGTYKYNAKENSLELIAEGDFRKNFGTQDFVQEASAVLAFIADYSRTRTEMDKNKRINYAYIDAGYISQNAYLYAAANELSTVALGSFDTFEIEKVVKLRPEQQIIITQPIGFAKK